jgi:nucleoside-diphosphate-sugar epimerase
MARANHAAEASANRFSAADGVGIVLRFGWFYGPGATHREEFLGLARRGICVMMGAPNTYVSSIHVADGGAVAAALTVAAGTYNVVDDEPLTNSLTRAHSPLQRASECVLGSLAGWHSCWVTVRHR